MFFVGHLRAYLDVVKKKKGIQWMSWFQICHFQIGGKIATKQEKKKANL